MLKRVTEDAGSLLTMLGRLGVKPQAVVHRPPGELARAVYNCLECFDRAVCDEMSTQDRRLSEAPGFCSNGSWISALMASLKPPSGARPCGAGEAP
jgi:hypothetical protein